MQVEELNIDDLIPYVSNAKLHPEEQVNLIASSIKNYGFNVPILVDKDNEIIAGHGRLMAARKLGMVKVPVIRCEDLSPAQVKAFRLAENKVAESNWDEALLGAELAELSELLGDELTDMTGFDELELDAYLGDDGDGDDGDGGGDERVGLADRFLVSPFSVLNAREGWWQSRKSAWVNIGIRSELGRGGSDKADAFSGQDRLNGIMGGQTADSGVAFAISSQPPEVYDKKSEYEKKVGHEVTWAEFYEVMPEVFRMSGTSIFDPVLCEIAYRWFCAKGGTVIDPFAGGSVRGVVAGRLGLKYVGCDLRQEQIDENYKQADEIGGFNGCEPVWHCTDSRNIDDVCSDITADFLFTCPPYADLEVYSDDPQDLSTLDYKDFRSAYFEIIKKSCSLLNDNRFACCVVGEVRDKRGNYYNFVGDTVQAFRDAGLEYYNEAILVTAVGTLPIRTGRQFAKGRKLGKTHQNILIFVKGDGKKATEYCGEIDVALPEIDSRCEVR